MKIYYAHPMTTYDKTIERTDIKMLEKLGFEIVNPNTAKIDNQYHEYKAEYTPHPEHGHMKFFCDIAASCDAIAFRAYPDGSIPSGTALEINAYKKKHPSPIIIELPTAIQSRILTYEETTEYIENTGF